MKRCDIAVLSNLHVQEDLHVQEEGSTEHDCKRLKPSEVAVAGEPNAATQGSAALSHDKTGVLHLSALPLAYTLLDNHFSHCCASVTCWYVTASTCIADQPNVTPYLQRPLCVLRIDICARVSICKQD